MNNMTLTQAMTYLQTLLNQQMSDEAEEAIRTVLDGMKQRVEIVRCRECKHFYYDVLFKEFECGCSIALARAKETDFCSYGERK